MTVFFSSSVKVRANADVVRRRDAARVVRIVFILNFRQMNINKRER
jgi:hypothetical protein